ncbi:predicted protein [Histoplasma capsulatum var. duboisii H88]|uniref:Predicted protein n=1 Tax=Ajellomyces capsulatus (strain H88) TaxID=544711 RepID=F0US33_AJEC8|nr:predicted protein [Histoplasma capsulatum var. duboisii H88]
MEAGLPGQGLCIIREAKQKTWDKVGVDVRASRESPGKRSGSQLRPRSEVERGKQNKASSQNHGKKRQKKLNPTLTHLGQSPGSRDIGAREYKNLRKIPTQTLGSISSSWAFHRSSWSALGHSPASGGKTGTIKPEFNLSLLFQKQKKRLGGLSKEARQDVTLRQICNHLSELEIFLACPQG